MEYAYSFEVCNQQGALVGGLYGVAMGKAFFGESMFHTERDASKVALVYLIEWMKLREMELLDTQYITDHLKSLGGIEITQEEYLEKLLDALR
jgi:leucyl/phenylalanyl-tRNA--protein transferase